MFIPALKSKKMRKLAVTQLEPKDLATAILSEQSGQTIIIDVRDADYEGGNIKGSVNIPYFDEAKASELATTVIDKNITMVVFHCYFCRMRGPTAAKLFAKVLGTNYPDQSAHVKIKVLRGGWSNWKNNFKADDKLVENVKQLNHFIRAVRKPETE